MLYSRLEYLQKSFYDVVSRPLQLYVQTYDSVFHLNYVFCPIVLPGLITVLHSMGGRIELEVSCFESCFKHLKSVY